jgi:RND family efflux transporter MFP subunit
MRLKALAISAALLAAAAAGGFLLLQGLYPVVEVAAVSTGPAVQAVYATGVVEPVQWAKIGPVTTGRIVAMEAEEGQTVEAGAVLARLDDREAKARVAELEARIRYLEEQVRRYARLRETGAASQQIYDQAVSELNQSRAALAGAQKHLADMTLLSPLAGIVLRKDGEPGETVREGTVLYWVGATAPLWITADVDEDDIPLVRVGQKVLIRADAFPGSVLEGTVQEITPKGDPVNRTYRVRVTLPADTPLRIGMTTEVNIVVRETREAALVPATALRNGRVFVVEDGRAGARPVETGVVGAQRIEVLRGLKPGELVVVDPPPRLKDGARVRPRAAAGS